jgi:anti-anti-sigma factor
VLLVDPDPPRFAWEARERGSVLHVNFRGEVDLAVYNECLDGLEQPLAGPEGVIVVDLGDVTFIDSTGIRLLITLRQRAEARGKQLLISRVSRRALRVLDVSGLTPRFEYLEGHPPDHLPCPTCGEQAPLDAQSCPSCGSAL